MMELHKFNLMKSMIIFLIFKNKPNNFERQIYLIRHLKIKLNNCKLNNNKNKTKINLIMNNNSNK